ncbi:type IV pilus assembly protein PilM [Bacteriovorax sp. DB6_IX]|uniref:type IV pilus assembly protein PilM n=1 Tax=Bacteriovorax sp. DB6_IX TaxID=1353530 RepID=UPI00038A2370|nr:type IV pilus assembly protein PilM [Bacteriovorax sp. DB6_IX]EQC52591.1 type IV pilus assembly protein PilM [Bacteriovorax sp. DB6_IX]
MDLKSVKPQDVVDGVKDLLGLSSKKVIGLDIGLSSVKIAEVASSGDTFKLLKYASIPLPDTVLIEDEIQKEEELLSAIEEAFNEIGAKNPSVCLGLFGPNTVVRKLQLAGGDEEEIEDQVLWEAEQYLPFPVEESNLGHYVVGENEGGGVDVIVAAVRKDVLMNFRDIVDKAQGKIKIVDLTPLAISNVFEYTMVDEIANDEEDEFVKSWLILDIGAQKTECVIYKGGMPIFTKEIPVGGAMVTEEIQRQLGVNFSEAEDLKTNTDDSGNLPEEVSEIVKEINETFFNEIKKTIDFYVNSTSDDSIAECYVTGGSIQLPGLLDGLSDLLGVDVSVLNPFRAFEYDDKKIDEDDLSKIAYHGVVALGLAMRELR